MNLYGKRTEEVANRIIEAFRLVGIPEALFVRLVTRMYLLPLLAGQGVDVLRSPGGGPYRTFPAGHVEGDVQPMWIRISVLDPNNKQGHAMSAFL